MVTTLRELTDHAEKVGVKLVVETLTPYESNAFKSANDLIELFKRIDSPYIVGMCDVVPPFVQHESIMAYIDKLGEKMYHMHIIDGDQGTDSHIVPGEGSIPLPELFKELKDVGYEKTATLELVTGYINEPRLYARRAIDNARAYMKEAGFYKPVRKGDQQCLLTFMYIRRFTNPSMRTSRWRKCGMTPWISTSTVLRPCSTYSTRCAVQG